MKRSCQRHTTVLPLPTARAMARVPLPSADRAMIRARHTCFCGLLRLRMIVSSRTRSSAVTAMEIPLRIPNNRTKPNLQKLLFRLFVRCYPLVITSDASHPRFRRRTGSRRKPSDNHSTRPRTGPALAVFCCYLQRIYRSKLVSTAPRDPLRHGGEWPAIGDRLNTRTRDAVPDYHYLEHSPAHTQYEFASEVKDKCDYNNKSTTFRARAASA